MLEYDHAPVGAVAFRATEGDLKSSAEVLYKEAWDAPTEIADSLRDTAAWYLDLALDLGEIRALPETVRPLDGCTNDIAELLADDEDIPF